MGLVAGLAAFGISAWIVAGNTGGWEIFVIIAPVAAFLTGFVLWWSLMILRRRVTILFGLIVGALIGILAHPVAWYLAILWMYFSGATSSLGEPTLTPLEGLVSAPIYAVGSLFLVGWLSVPLGLVGGGLVAFIQSRVTRRAAAV
jgi:hypothetical protein